MSSSVIRRILATACTNNTLKDTLHLLRLYCFCHFIGKHHKHNAAATKYVQLHSNAMKHIPLKDIIAKWRTYNNLLTRCTTINKNVNGSLLAARRWLKFALKIIQISKKYHQCIWYALLHCLMCFEKKSTYSFAHRNICSSYTM